MSAPITWTCRDGRVLRIADMDTEHLRNTVAMLRRKGFLGPEEAERCFVGPGPQGEMAQMAWEQELDSIRVSRHLPALEAELAKRPK